MAVRQSALGIVARVRPGGEDALRGLLAEINRDVERNPHIPFALLRGVHFARCILVEAATGADGRSFPPYLVVSTYYDEPLDDHLQELAGVAGSGLERVFSHCEGFPEPKKGSTEDLLAFMRSHQADYTAMYIGTRGRSLEQIRQEATLRDELEDFLDQGRWDTTSPADVRAALRTRVASRPTLAWALTPDPPPSDYPDPQRDTALFAVVTGLVLTAALIAWGGTTLLALPGWVALLLLAPVALLLVGVWVLSVRLSEVSDPTPAVAHGEADEKASELVGNEDFVVQNQLTHLVELKPGPVRRFTLNLVFLLVDFLARRKYTHGDLGGIPSIHFARWIQLDGGRRLLFVSDFDGSWESYLGEFIDRAAAGLTAVWSNTLGFPLTEWLITRGARDEQSFKQWTREHQITTNVWYSAYKRLSVQNINNNSRIRAGLAGELSPAATEAWLRLF